MDQNDMAGRNIALIGGKCMMMYQTQVNEFNWKKVFGIDLSLIHISEPTRH